MEVSFMKKSSEELNKREKAILKFIEKQIKKRKIRSKMTRFMII